MKKAESAEYARDKRRHGNTSGKNVKQELKEERRTLCRERDMAWSGCCG